MPIILLNKKSIFKLEEEFKACLLNCNYGVTGMKGRRPNFVGTFRFDFQAVQGRVEQESFIFPSFWIEVRKI